MNYGDLIKDAFRISWRNKYLWFFGFFAGGTSSGFNVSTIPSAVEAVISTTSTLAGPNSPRRSRPRPGGAFSTTWACS